MNAAVVAASKGQRLSAWATAISRAAEAEAVPNLAARTAALAIKRGAVEGRPLRLFFAQAEEQDRRVGSRGE